MTAVRVPVGGGQVSLENLTERFVFADLERPNGAQTRLLLEPREKRTIPLREGHVFITTSPGVLVK